MFGRRFDMDRDIAHAEQDRCDPLALGKREEGPAHQILGVTRGDISGDRTEQVKLPGSEAFGCHGLPSTPGIRRPSRGDDRSEEHTSELQSLMRISYAVFCLKKKKQKRILRN